MGDPRLARRAVTRLSAAGAERVEDTVAVERALEIRVGGRALAVTLRTPGDDEELTLGFLAGEGVIRSGAEVRGLALVPAACADEPDRAEVTLADGVTLDWARLERHFAATSACGLCGRAHLEALRAGLECLPAGRSLDPTALAALSARVRAAQPGFAASGGLHAAAYCADDLGVEVVREDVGRHNAVDKVCGWLARAGRYPAGAGLLWVSGRAGAELVLKAARARIPALVAVGAPTTLAIELADVSGLTLVGFLREGRMNVYGGGDRFASHGGGAVPGRD